MILEDAQKWLEKLLPNHHKMFEIRLNPVDKTTIEIVLRFSILRQEREGISFEGQLRLMMLEMKELVATKMSGAIEELEK